MDYLQRRAALTANRNVTLLLDVGANKGQFAHQMRSKVGYRGRIVSFEPLADAFKELQETASSDPLWTCHNVGLSDTTGAAIINISANSHSSSILDVSERSLRIEPDIAYVGKQQVQLHRLDRILGEVARADDVIYLKIDTQGYEMNVLRGALGVLHRIALIQLEASFVPVYKNEVLIGDIIKFLDYLGFCIVSVEEGWGDLRSGEMFQADLIFSRKPETQF